MGLVSLHLALMQTVIDQRRRGKQNKAMRCRTTAIHSKGISLAVGRIESRGSLHDDLPHHPRPLVRLAVEDVGARRGERGGHRLPLGPKPRLGIGPPPLSIPCICIHPNQIFLLFPDRIVIQLLWQTKGQRKYFFFKKILPPPP